MSDRCKKNYTYDERRYIEVPGDREETLKYCAEQFIDIANKSIADHEYFSVALSGGSTPNGIFALLADKENRNKVDWKKVRLFWSDERAVAPDHPESNYHMAMEAGLNTLGIPDENIYRMVAENDIDSNALAYEALILEKLEGASFDLVMLGMGEDGHTASLFPHTYALQSQDRLVTANYVPKLHSWRMTLTFDCINAGKVIAIYTLGKSKGETLKKILQTPYNPSEYPVQAIGTVDNPALWIIDSEAAAMLPSHIYSDS